MESSIQVGVADRTEAVRDEVVREEPAARVSDSRLSAYFELTKPRITFLVVLTAAAGYAVGAKGGLSLARFLWTSLGIALLSSGISALNQYIERDLDRLMNRTKLRPLPTGRIVSVRALLFGAVLSAAGLAVLALMVSWLTALLGFATLVGYLFAYT
ncbi:MAG TPA: protoheme IX farnesyltransferase, partial [Blastocatellia bacterium]|nr:protoheme IX farnesyltransferase [Blastocatellia bacterium]